MIAKETKARTRKRIIEQSIVMLCLLNAAGRLTQIASHEYLPMAGQ